MAPFISLHQVSKSFGDVRAVDNVDLEISQGELFCLLGSSGSGKTTLLRMLAGFERPDSGIIEIDGQNMDGVDPADRPVNIMFQNYALFPHYSVAKNIGYGLVRAGISGQALKDRVNELLKMVRLEGHGDRKPHQLSGGQRQRVALARASPANQNSFFWTNLLPRLIKSCAKIHSLNLSPSKNSLAPLLWLLLTTRKKPWSWLTVLA